MCPVHFSAARVVILNHRRTYLKKKNYSILKVWWWTLTFLDQITFPWRKLTVKLVSNYARFSLMRELWSFLFSIIMVIVIVLNTHLLLWFYFIVVHVHKDSIAGDHPSLSSTTKDSTLGPYVNKSTLPLAVGARSEVLFDNPNTVFSLIFFFYHLSFNYRQRFLVMIYPLHHNANLPVHPGISLYILND